jgi:hypothetical protein
MAGVAFFGCVAISFLTNRRERRGRREEAITYGRLRQRILEIWDL